MNSSENGMHGGPVMRTVEAAHDELADTAEFSSRAGSASPELRRSLAEIKG